MGVTLIFPGQGSQYVGMGKNLISDIKSNELFGKADSTLEFSLTDIMFNGPEENLKLTKFTQPAILTHSIALFNLLNQKLSENNIPIDQVLGHSVGEYAALVAAGSIDFKDAVKAVHYRGMFMQEAVSEGMGAMTAIIKVPESIVLEACEKSSMIDSIVMPANFNEPNQIVISGHADAVARATAWLKENYLGKHMAIPLKVSAPFHSTLMKPAENKLKEFFSTIKINSNKIPYYANIDASLYTANTASDVIKNNLISQVSGSVRWNQSIAKIKDPTIFIEVGPGKVLTGLNKKINADLKTFTLDSEDGINKCIEYIKENL